MCRAGCRGRTADLRHHILGLRSRARPSLDFPLGCRLPCRSQAATLPRLPMPKAPGPAGPLQYCQRGHPGLGRGGRDQGLRGALLVVVPLGCHPLLPSLTSAGVAGCCLGIPRTTKTSTVETLICGEDFSKICLYITYLHTHYYHNDT